MKLLVRAAQIAAARLPLCASLAAAGIFGASLFAAPPSFAHEFWIEPDPAEAGALGQGDVALRLFVGEQFAGEELAWDPTRVEEFRAISSSETSKLAGEAGAAPAAWLPSSSSGPQLITYRSRPAWVTLEPSAFADYLRADGLDAILEIRRARGEQDLPGRERFTRFCKAILAPEEAAPSGGWLDALWPRGGPRQSDSSVENRVVGHRLEIVPVETKGRGRPAVERTFRVLFEGAPLSGAVIAAAPKSDPQSGLVRARTDGDGFVRIRMDRPGLWLVSLVHMVECKGCPDADWDSSWASLVLSMPSGP